MTNGKRFSFVETLLPLPCPFCGSSDVVAAFGIVSCYLCNAEISLQNTNTYYAIQVWNCRNNIESDKAYKAKNNAILQAKIWAQEARTQKAVVKEISKLVGCKNDWEVVEAVKKCIFGEIV